MTPAWLLDLVAALMLGVAAVSAARLVAALLPWPAPWLPPRLAGQRGGTRADTDVAHLLMSIAMAGMLAPGLRTLPDPAWAAAFGLLATWFAVRVARDARLHGPHALAGGHCAPHLVHSCSMLYMLLAMTATTGTTAAVASGMGGMGTPGSQTLRYPTLALAFAFILVGYSIWDLDQLSGRRYSPAPARVALAGVTAPGAPALSAALALPAQVTPQPGTAKPGANHQPGAANVAAIGCGPADAQAATGYGTFLLSPAVTVACRIAMGIAMAFMLFIAI